MTLVGQNLGAVPDVGKGQGAERARRGSAAIVGLIAGTMLLAWIARVEFATRTDTLAPMSPLACVGFIAAAAGVWALPDRHRAAGFAGTVAFLAGAVGIAD